MLHLLQHQGRFPLVTHDLQNRLLAKASPSPEPSIPPKATKRCWTVKQSIPGPGKSSVPLLRCSPMVSASSNHVHSTNAMAPQMHVCAPTPPPSA